ncbi:MAG: FXSXX-COOH protein [Pseudonocardiales bacterium]|nr:FXSXX-COOH protein [Pseudonocardiales bacterium]
MSENTTGHDHFEYDDVLIDVSEFTLRQLANEIDDSSLARTLRRLLDSREGDGAAIAGWSSFSPHPSDLTTE